MDEVHSEQDRSGSVHTNSDPPRPTPPPSTSTQSTDSAARRLRPRPTITNQHMPDIQEIPYRKDPRNGERLVRPRIEFVIPNGEIYVEPLDTDDNPPITQVPLEPEAGGVFWMSRYPINFTSPHGLVTPYGKQGGHHILHYWVGKEPRQVMPPPPQGWKSQDVASHHPPAQPLPAQPLPAQNFPAQPFQGQSLPGQLFPDQPFPAQPLPAQTFPAQLFQGQRFQGQLFSVQPSPAQRFQGQPLPGQLFPAQPFPAQPLQGEPLAPLNQIPQDIGAVEMQAQPEMLTPVSFTNNVMDRWGPVHQVDYQQGGGVSSFPQPDEMLLEQQGQDLYQPYPAQQVADQHAPAFVEYRDQSLGFMNITEDGQVDPNSVEMGDILPVPGGELYQ